MYIVDFAKQLFRKANVGVIVYLVLNITLYVGLLGGFAQISMAAVGILLYFVTLCIALSPAGEFIFRLQTGCRKIKRQDYLARLMPLFEEVYAQAKAKDPTISDVVKLYMSEDSSPNAFATGRRTICLTKGFMSYTDEQIKGTLAHEFAHLAHRDTDLLLLISVGNMLMTAIFVIYRIVINIFVFFFATALNLRFLGTFLTSFFINTILSFFMWVWTKIGILLVMHSGRQNEYEADQFAFELGYGNDLCVVLDSLDGGDTKSHSIWAQLHSTHPATDDRIARLQQLGASYANMYGHDVRAVNANPQQYGYEHKTPPVMPSAGTGNQQPSPQAGKAKTVLAGAAALVQSASKNVQTRLQQPASVQEQAAQPPAEDALPLCIKCGSPLPVDKHFCSKCGTSADAVADLIEVQHCVNCNCPLKPDKKFCAKCGMPVIEPILCEQCGYTLDKSDLFCPECGVRIAGEEAVEVEPVLCVECGCELEDGDMFCPECGTPLAPDTTVEVTPTLCEQCGCVLDDGELFCGECGAPVASNIQENPTTCPVCGVVLELDCEFCSECGAQATCV